MVAEVDVAHKEGETLGGVVEVLAYGLPRDWAATSTGTGASTRAWPLR